MKELWIKKTVYRRYVIADYDQETVESILRHEPERAEELIGDIYDKNDEVEYDDEKLVTPISYNINALAK